MRPLLLIGIVIVALTLLKVFVIDAPAQKDKAGSKAGKSMAKATSKLAVDIYVAKEEDTDNTVFASGTVVPNEEVELKSEVSGRLIKLNFKEGAYVQKGQLIAKLNDKDLVAQLKKLEFEEELATQIEARQKKLLEIDAISKEEYDMAVNKINTLSADKDLLQVMLEKTEVRAPFSGKIGLKNISEGAYLTPSTIITNLVQSDPVKIDFAIPEKYSNLVQLNQKVNFTIDGTDDIFEAQVIALDPKVDEDLRTLKIRARASNQNGRLLPGMFVRVNVPLGTDRSIMIPTEAIVPILKGKKVFVMKEGKAAEAIVKTGLRTDTDVQIEEGLTVGDSVIVSALMSIKPNLSVQVRTLVD
jgi:membrane fusion protein (multidrug efflux system)